MRIQCIEPVVRTLKMGQMIPRPRDGMPPTYDSIHQPTHQVRGELTKEMLHHESACTPLMPRPD